MALRPTHAEIKRGFREDLSWQEIEIQRQTYCCILFQTWLLGSVELGPEDELVLTSVTLKHVDQKTVRKTAKVLPTRRKTCDGI